MRMSSTKHSLCVVVDGVVANKQRRVEGFSQQRVDGDHHQQHRQLQHGVQSQEHRTRHHRQHPREYKILWTIKTHGQLHLHNNVFKNVGITFNMTLQSATAALSVKHLLTNTSLKSSTTLQMNMKNITDLNLINIPSESSSHGPLYCFQGSCFF